MEKWGEGQIMVRRRCGFRPPLPQAFRSCTVDPLRSVQTGLYAFARISPPVPHSRIKYWGPLDRHLEYYNTMCVFSLIEEIGLCSENQCRNGATCVDMVTYKACICAPGFYGSRCEMGGYTMLSSSVMARKCCQSMSNHRCNTIKVKLLYNYL